MLNETLKEIVMFYGILNLAIHLILFIGWQFGLVGFNISNMDD